MRVTIDESFTTLVVVLAALAFSAPVVRAEEEKPEVKIFGLEEAVEFALQHHPGMRSALEEKSAASAGVTLAKTSYLPRLDALWQSNLATRNNIVGLLLPQAVIPSISGPVLARTDDEAVRGNAGGLLLSWEPIDFGARKASVDAARGAEQQATAEADLTRLEIAVEAADGFITMAAAQEEVRAAKADVERRQVFATSVHALVNSQLRPGADSSRAEAELAAARIRLIQAESVEEVSETQLSRTLGIAGAAVEVDAQPLLRSIPVQSPGESIPSAHPLAAAGRASVEELQADVRLLARSYAPKFIFQSAAFGRASEANPDGTVSGGLDSLALDRYNWAVGLTVSFPLLDFASVRARKGVQTSKERSAEARYEAILQEVTTQAGKARAVWESARKVVEQTPIQLEAARSAENQTRARYQAGLGTIVEVADAERLLVQAEIEDALAKLGVWRGLLQMAAAGGDSQPFLQAVRAASSGGS